MSLLAGNASTMVEEVVDELELVIPGIDATRYLSVAGLIVLLYDHLLLLSVEVDVVWPAKWTVSKFLFLTNRYTLPIVFFINSHLISGISSVGLTTTLSSLAAVSRGIRYHVIGDSELYVVVLRSEYGLATSSVFVAQRVWILSARNLILKRFLIVAFTVVYLVTYGMIAFVFSRTETTISFSPDLGICALDKKQPLLVLLYCIPIVVDVFIFLLTCYNAFDRPRHLESWLIKQLITDGIVYFVCLLSLRTFNIVVISSQSVQFSQLGVYFIWTMITALVNRMLLTREFTEREWDEFNDDFCSPLSDQVQFDMITIEPSLLVQNDRRRSHLRW